MCHICTVGGPLPSFVPQSGVFPQFEVYEGVVVIPEFLYPDGSIVIDAIQEVLQKKLEYNAYYETGDFTLPSPDGNFYASAANTAKRFIKRYNEANPNGPPAKKQILLPQSGVLTSESLSKDMGQILTTFVNDTMYEEVSFDIDHERTLYSRDSDIEQLKHFLSRPTNIASYVVTPNTQSAALNPLTTPVVISPGLFFTNKRVMNRMNNFRNFKCDVCFKFMINGSPFHYGRFFAGVLPNSGDDNISNPTGITTAGNQSTRMRISQLPGVYLNPTTSQGGCLRMPYLHKFEAFNTSTSEQNDLGVIVLAEFAPLQQIGPAVDTITISVMAWAENIVFGAPTTNNLPGLVPQSSDEYSEPGPVEHTANVLAKVSGQLIKIPSIAPYARVSQYMFSSLSSMAHIFGFSRPSVITDFHTVRERKYPNFASTNQKDPIYKMTLDDKQEVTVDPRVVGFSGKDSMAISDIIEREACVSGQSWQTSMLPGKALFFMNVSPNFWVTGIGATAPQISMCPMTYAAQAFRYWRGSIRFRFVAVASSFHRGRLRIIYDPAGFGNTTATTVYESNTNYNYIWDLSESHEAIIDVCHMSNLAYNRTVRPGASGVTGGVGTTFGASGISHSPQFDNGTLAVVVQNDLTCSGQAVSDITILCYACAGPDFEFFEPENSMNNYSFFPQSGEMMQDDLMLRSAKKVNAVFGNYIKPDDKAAHIFHGDPIVSLRALFKRYNLYTVLPMPAIPTGNTLFTWNISAFPLHRGKAPNGMHLTGTASTNYVNNTHLSWFAPLFLGRRGGIRLRITDMSTSDLQGNHLILTRTPTANYLASVSVAPAGTSSSALARSYVSTVGNLGLTSISNGNAGFALGEALAGGRMVIDAEVPYYTNKRYYPCRRYDLSAGSDMGATILMSTTNSTTTAKSGLLNVAVAAADDFSFIGYINTPVVYYVPALP